MRTWLFSLSELLLGMMNICDRAICVQAADRGGYYQSASPALRKMSESTKGKDCIVARLLVTSEVFGWILVGPVLWLMWRDRHNVQALLCKSDISSGRFQADAVSRLRFMDSCGTSRQCG